MSRNRWTFDDEAYGRLDSLMQIVSPSMNETDMASSLRKKWADHGLATETDVMGNVCSVKEGKRSINLAICAHMDTIAVQITKILPNGMLLFRRIGFSPHVLLGQRLVITTHKGLVSGVVGFDPTSQFGQPKGLVEEDLWIDICASSQMEAEALVCVGDLGVVNYGMMTVNGDFICGSALDNKIGLFVMNECMRWYAGKEVPVNLHFVATVQEEVGLRGGIVAAAHGDYDVCIILDVDYATDTPVPHDNQMGVLKLGAGAGLQIKADNNPVLRKLAEEVAGRENIDIQMSLGRFIYGGTDASSIQLAGNGVATLNVSLPCRYMHSPAEICHKKDVESAINLLIGVVEEVGRRASATFIPGIDYA